MWAPSSSLHTTQPLPGLRGRPGSHHPLPARPAARPSSAATTTSDAAAHCNSQLDGERAASCSTSAQPASAAPTRRTVTGAALAALTSLSSAMLQWARPQAAHALRTVELPDGRSVEVFEHGMSLAIMALRGSVPQQWVMDFKASLGKYAGFTLGQCHQLEDIYKELPDTTTKNSAGLADVVTLGDAWLGQAIRANLVQPIPNAELHRWWRQMSPRWRQLVRRNAAGQADPSGQVYGAPYRWGATLIAYRKDRLLRRGGAPVTDWADLLQPALKGRVAVTDSSRELLGLALKTLGLGYNPSLQQLQAAGVTREALAQRLRVVRSQVRLFSSRDHVRALQAGDVWAVVGWSQDLVTLAERMNSVVALVPSSGTSLFADLWAVPRGAQGGHLQLGPSPLLPSWLEFGLQPARVPSRPGLKTGASPLLLPEPDAAAARTEAGSDGCDAVLQHSNSYMPCDAVLRRSEFLLPLSPAVVELYRGALQDSGA